MGFSSSDLVIPMAFRRFRGNGSVISQKVMILGGNAENDGEAWIKISEEKF